MMPLLKNLSSLFILILLTSAALAQTNVGGIINSNTTWDIDGSPYELTSAILITSDAVLTIEPGVTVNFNNNSLTAQGGVEAVGNEAGRITFTFFQEDETLENFDGRISFLNSSSPYNPDTHSGTVFQYCNFNTSSDPPLKFNNSASFVGNSVLECMGSSVLEYCGDSFWGLIKDGSGASIFTDNYFINFVEPINIGWGEDLTVFSNNVMKRDVGIQQMIFRGYNQVINNCFDGLGEFGVEIDHSVIPGQQTVFMHNRFINYSGPNAAVNIGGSDASILLDENYFDNNDVHIKIACPAWQNDNYNIIAQNNIFGSFNDKAITTVASENCGLELGSYNEYDFSNNYWNGLTSQEIDEAIFDFEDDFSSAMLINYGSSLTESPIIPNNCIDVETGISSLAETKEELLIYPNPVHDILTVECPKNTTITVLDIHGKSVYASQYNNEMVSIDMSAIAKGIYIVEVAMDARVIRKKIVKD